MTRPDPFVPDYITPPLTRAMQIVLLDTWSGYTRGLGITVENVTRGMISRSLYPSGQLRWIRAGLLQRDLCDEHGILTDEGMRVAERLYHHVYDEPDGWIAWVAQFAPEPAPGVEPGELAPEAESDKP